jgi:small conductance mechanosensitive channel
MMSVAPAAPAAAPAVVPAEPSAAEKLFSGFGALWRNLSALEPSEVVLNLGLSILVVAAVALVIWIMRRLLHAGIGKLAAKGVVPRDSLAPVKEPPRIARLSWLLVRAILLLVAVLVLLSIWGLDLLGWLTTTGTGATLSRLVGVLLIAVALIELAGHVVDRVLGLLARRLGGGRRNAQVNTLGPLIRGLVQGFIVVVASLTILSELGVQIGPLLASAGVVGIAVGFGAQTLVKDFLTGLFLVVEDIVAVGDDVAIGDFSGAVEAMTLRTIRLRNADGSLHVLPYSEAQVISNRTKTYSAYLFEIGVAYQTDFDKALAIMARVGEEMRADPAFADKILGPPDILGVDRLGESTVTLKARLRTRPGDHGAVGREYNRRMMKAFDEGGVELPLPTRKVITETAQAAEEPDGPRTPPPPKAGQSISG